MNIFRVFIAVLFSFFLFLSGCSKKAEVSLHKLTPVKKSSITFIQKDVPAQCKVFSHLIINTPANATGTKLHATLLEQGKSSGADLILLGSARENKDEEQTSYSYHSYGPSAPYNFQKKWQGYKFGHKQWRQGGDLIGVDMKSLNDKEHTFHASLMLQAVYLSCQQGPQF